MTEAYITKKVKEYLMELKNHFGPAFYFQKVSDRFTDGIPDYYITFRGKSLWLELKAPGERPRPLQIYVLKRLAKAGNMAEWTDNIEDARECIDEFVSTCDAKSSKIL